MRTRTGPALAGVVALILTFGAAVPAATAAPRSVPLPRAAGDRTWVDRFDGGGYDDAVAAVASPDGSRVYVTGGSDSPNRRDYITVAYDGVTGRRLFVKRYDDPTHGYDFANAIGLSPDGSTLFVTGFSSGVDDYDYLTVAYDAITGKHLWSARFNGEADDLDDPTALAVSRDGTRVYVTGTSRDGPRSDYATVAYRADTGAQLWTAHFSGSKADAPRGIAVSRDGSKVFIAATTLGYSLATIAFDTSTGNRAWIELYHGSAHLADAATALGISPSGDAVYIAGTTYTTDEPQSKIVTVAYDPATGARKWVSLFAPPGSYGADAPTLAVGPGGGRVYMTGTSDNQGSFDYAAVAIDAATGRKVWARTYDTPTHGNDFSSAIAVSPDGSKVFVTGASEGARNFDYLTIAIGASGGRRLWSRRYDDPAKKVDMATAIVASPKGSRVFVTGGAGKNDDVTASDYTTLAYRTS